MLLDPIKAITEEDTLVTSGGTAGGGNTAPTDGTDPTIETGIDEVPEHGGGFQAGASETGEGDADLEFGQLNEVSQEETGAEAPIFDATLSAGAPATTDAEDAGEKTEGSGEEEQLALENTNLASSGQSAGDDGGVNTGGGLVPTVPTQGEKTLDVAGGRVTTIQVEDAENAVSVKILTKPEHGNLTVNPDNSLALVLTGETYSGELPFTVEVTYADNSKSVIDMTANVAAVTQQAGWGQGDFYMLETDAEGDLVVETGQNHRKVYVSNSDDALSIADIAAIENVPESHITQWWLAGHPEYGSSEDSPLKVDAALKLWHHITGGHVEPNSNWLLFERGYEYHDTARIVTRGTQGESELNPVHITAWGEGDRPVIHDRFGFNQEKVSNLVVSELKLNNGLDALKGENIIFDDIDLTGWEFNAQDIEGLTVRNSEIHDIHRDNPTDLNLGWRAGEDKIQGMYVSRTDGLLLEGNIIENNGWRAGYDQVTGIEALDYHPPSQFSHNIYLQFNTTDVTVRDNIISQAASFGLQARGGAFIEDNVFADNNIPLTILGGDYQNLGPIGNFSLVSDNVFTEAGHKLAETIGAVSWGPKDEALDTTFLDNMVVHLADPNDPDAMQNATIQGPAMLLENSPYFDNTLIYNWLTGQNAHRIDETAQNIENADPALMLQTTIQNFAKQLTGDANSTVESLMNYLRSQASNLDGETGFADQLVEYFQAGFGMLGEVVSNTGQTVRFVPSDLGDGVRWDNRLNWSTNDVAGTRSTDNVDLGGNWVNYGGTHTINQLNFGDGGRLNVEHGKLTIDGGFQTVGAEARLTIDDAGQVWVNGFNPAEDLLIGINGGRFANYGDFKGEIKMAITDGQALFGAGSGIFETTAGSHIAIIGSDAEVGFDDDNNSDMALRLGRDSTLTFVADEDGFSTIGEVRSGAFGDSPNGNVGINLGRADLNLDLTALQGKTGFYTLMEADALIGEFSDINVYGIAQDQNVALRVDHVNDRVTLWFSDVGVGSGDFRVNTYGSQINANGTGLWPELTEDFGKGVWKRDSELAVFQQDFTNELDGLF